MSRLHRMSALCALFVVACAHKDGTLDAATPPDAAPPDATEADATGFPETGITTGNDLLVTRVQPGHGPAPGGNQVIVRGTGFTENASVWFGDTAVQLPDQVLVDERRLRVVVPAGDVGDVDVRVEIGGNSVTLPNGYTYDAFFLEPDRGAISGGTRITLTGTGTAFAEGDEVALGGIECRNIEVVSPTRIDCLTPPATAPGTVDVTVTSALDGTDLTVEDGFTYFESSDPFAGGFGGGALEGTLNITVVDADSGAPVTEAFVIVGENGGTPYQGLSDLRGQISFSGDDLTGEQTIHIAKECYQNTSFVSFDARDVTAFLKWICPIPAPPGFGPGRQGSFISGDLVWLGPNEYGPNPWSNIPQPRENEVKVAYVYTTQRCPGDGIYCVNPDPSLGGGVQRVLEVLPNDGEDHLGYPYRIFARPAGLAVYALGGLENTLTGEFLPYVMGVARNVLAGPGVEVQDVDVLMNIPLDHVLDVRINDLPGAVDFGPDRFRVEADIDLGGEGVIVRRYPDTARMDVVRTRTNEDAFRLFAQPALLGTLEDGRYRVNGGWFTGEGENIPYTEITLTGVRDTSTEVVLDKLLGIPLPTSPANGEPLPEDRVLRWDVTGPAPDMFVVLVALPGEMDARWMHFVTGDIMKAPVPDLSELAEVADLPADTFLIWQVYAIDIADFDFNRFSYEYLNSRYWERVASDQFAFQM